MSDRSDGARELWESLITAYSEQNRLSHTEAAAEVEGCTVQSAWRVYNRGQIRLGLPAIKDILAAQRAENRAGAGADGTGEEPSLITAQDDARKVAMVEGRMIAASRMSVAGLVTQMAGLIEAVAPVIERLHDDIVAAAEPDTADGGKGGSFADRRAVMREVFWYQKQMLRMVSSVMDLERKLKAAPKDLIGAELTPDIKDLVRRARESSRALDRAASLLEMPGPTTEH